MEELGFDEYKVDFGVYTSEQNCWTTQMEGPVIKLNNRNAMDDRILMYTSSPVSEDVQITGTPTVTLQLSSTHTDGAVLVYLEEVDEKTFDRIPKHGKPTLTIYRSSDCKLFITLSIIQAE